MGDAAAEVVYGKPSGYKDGAALGFEDSWLNDKSRFGMRFCCKRCGAKGGGYGHEERGHRSDCRATQRYRDARANTAARLAETAQHARARLAQIDWNAVSDNTVTFVMKAVCP